VDAWALERSLSGLAYALEKVKPSGEDGLDALAARLMGIYRGQFMAGDAHQFWAITRSERLRNRFLRTAGAYCRRLQSMDRHEEAIDLYQKQLEVEPLAEDLYRNLMGCYLKLGRVSEGIKVCQRCRKVLSETLGTGLSPATEKICKQLQSMS
jgi:two-component SAPR family response regulator